MRNWTPEERQRQRELIQRWKPWTKSTGPKTIVGKARASKNSLKDGNSIVTRELIKNLSFLLKFQKKLIKRNEFWW